MTLRTEPMSAQDELNAAAVAQRILYTSTDVRWKAGIVPVSGTLYLPRGAPPVGGWPLVAWAHGTLGVAEVCAPSWTQHRPRDATNLNRWLEQGFAVVATDYQGLGGPGPHPYLIWEAEGRSLACGEAASDPTLTARLERTLHNLGRQVPCCMRRAGSTSRCGTPARQARAQAIVRSPRLAQGRHGNEGSVG